jgi:general secretion pathway protein D
MNRYKKFFRTGVSTCTLMLSVCLPAVAKRPPSAKSLYQAGLTAEAKDDPISAYNDYAKAYHKDPKNLRYKTAYNRLKFLAAATFVSSGEKLAAQGDFTNAMTQYLRALEIDPSNAMAEQDIQAAKRKLSTPVTAVRENSIPEEEQAELDEVEPPVELSPVSDEPITLHMTEDSKIVYQTVGKAAGINVLFDPSYTSKRIQIDLANVSLLDALRIIGTVSGTFWHAVTPNTIFVAEDTRTKRQQLEEQAVQTFYLANTAQQNDLNDIQTALRNLLTGAKLYGVPSQNAIVMRATPDELLLAQKLISDLDKARPEVVVDVALVEVNRDTTNTIGIQLPGSFGLQLQPPNAYNTTNTANNSTTPTNTQNLTLNNVAHLNSTEFAVTVGQATANMLLADTDTKVLQNPSIRATDGQKADLKIGTRIPVATGSYQTGAATAVVSSLVNTQFTYLDVGVEIEITPIVHYNNDVTLKIKVVSSQESGSTNIGGITEPIIGQKTAEQTVRLKEGEVNILGGFLQRQDLLTVGGTPFLGEIPILKYLFSSQQHEIQDDEIIFMLTPHVVRATEINPLNLQEIDTGTGTDVELRRVSVPAPPRPALTQQPAEEAPDPVKPAPAATLPPAANAAPAPAANAGAPQANSTAPVGGVSLQVIPPAGSPKVGGTFQVSIRLNGGQDVFSVPLQLHYDSAKMNLINVDSGDFLGRDGQAIALVHRDDGSGNVAISSSRPPGALGISGSGVLCVLTFQATASGDGTVAITRSSVRNSAQQSAELAGAQATVHIR